MPGDIDQDFQIKLIFSQKERKMPVRSIILLAAAVFVIAGCGGDDADGDDAGVAEVTTSSLTKTQYVEQANKACGAERAKLFTRIAEYNKENPDSTVVEGTPDFAAIVEATMLPTYQAEVDAVRALGAPTGEEAEVESILAAKEEAIDEAAEQGVESIQEIEDGFGEANKEFQDYGLSNCAVGSSAPRQG